MLNKIRGIIAQTEDRISLTTSGISRALLRAVLLALYILMGLHQVLLVLFFPAHNSFTAVSFLDQHKGYTSSYSGHLRLKHNLRFGTLAYSLVVVTGVMFVHTAVQIINPEQFGQAVFASNFVVNSSADTDDGVCDVTNCTLREAIAAADPNDTITFAAAYSITLTQALPPLATTGLTLDGIVGNNQVIINCNHAVDVGLQINANIVTVQNLTVEYCNTFGIEVLSNANNFIISAVQLNDNFQDGLKIKSGTGGNVSNSTSTGNAGRGLVAIGRTGLSISGSTFQNNAQSGIALESSTSTAFIDSNNFFLNGEDGIRITGTSHTPTISNNFIGVSASAVNNANIGNGISIADTTGATISNNVIAYNAGTGVIFSNVSNSTVTNNQIGVYSGNYTPNGVGVISLTAGSSHNTIGVSMTDIGTGNSLYSGNGVNVISMTGNGTTANAARNNRYFNTVTSSTMIVGDGAAATAVPAVSNWSSDTVTGTATSQAIIDLYDYATGQHLANTTTDAIGNWSITNDALSTATGLAVMATTATGSSSFIIASSQNLELSNIAVTTITATTATITWNTNVASDTQVSYQPSDASELVRQSSNDAAVTNHSITITDLIPDTRYDCTITSIDSSNADNQTSSTDCTFTTAAIGSTPTISAITVSAITAHTVKVTWLTNVAAYSRVDYGTTTSYGFSNTDTTATTNHAITLTDLTETTLYHYRITISDDAGHVITSDDATFTTDNYLDAVASTIRVTDSQGKVTHVTSDSTRINLPVGDLLFQFTDTDRSFTSERLQLVIALAKKNAQAVFDKTKKFTTDHKVQFKIDQDQLTAASTYKVKTGLVDEQGNYLNPSGLKKRFTFTVQAVPQLLSPSLINYRMPSSFVVTSKTDQVTVYLKTTTGQEVFHCVAKMSDSIGECQPPFSVAQGHYVVQLVDAAGGSISQDLYISTTVPSGVLVTDDRSSHFTSRIIYTGNPTFTGITTAGHSIEVHVPQINGAMLADVASAATGTATPWQFTLRLTTLPYGVTTFTIIDRRADGSVAAQMRYPVLRTPRAVQPAVITPDNNQRFADVAPVIQVIGPTDHSLDVMNSAGAVLFTTGFNNGGTALNLSQWFKTPGSYQIRLRNHNSIGLPSADTTFSFSIYRSTTTTSVSKPITTTLPPLDQNSTPSVPLQPILDLHTIEQTLQAGAQAEDLHYPAITTTTLTLSSEQREQVAMALTDSIARATVFTAGVQDQANVVTRHHEWNIIDWFTGRSSEQQDATTLTVYGDITLPEVVRTLPSYVVVSFFSTPIVKIAEVDTHGHWTMTIPAELLSTGTHEVYAAAEVNGIQGDQVQVAKFVIEQKNTLSNTTWLVLINILIAFTAVVVSLVLQLKRKRVKGAVA